jgi:hypothetical protein
MTIKTWPFFASVYFKDTLQSTKSRRALKSMTASFPIIPNKYLVGSGHGYYGKKIILKNPTNKRFLHLVKPPTPKY